jgi:hypothetical protein
MAEATKISDEQLALLLQLSRDFAFQQLADEGHFVPFGTQARSDGEIEFIRVGDEHTDGSLPDVFDLLNRTLAERAEQGEIVAAATVANIFAAGSGVKAEPEFERAIRVHVEAPSFSRVVIAPYRVEDADEQGDKPYLVEGKMLTLDEVPVIFAR